MRLWFRPLQPADLPGCLEIMYNREIYSEEARARLPLCWKRLMEMGAAITTAVLDRDCPPEQQLVGFGISVIITEEFANRIRRQLSPDSAMTILNVLDGDSPPVLTRRSLGRKTRRTACICWCMSSACAHRMDQRFATSTKR